MPESSALPGSAEAAIAAALLDSCTRRAAQRPGGTICPSEVARALWPEGESWRAHMDQVRAVARMLALEGKIVIMQRGERVDPTAPWRGPIRLAIA